MTHKSLGFILLSLFLTACVNINIYFPTAPAEEAAGKIVDDILRGAPVNVKPLPEKDDQGALPGGGERFQGLATILNLLVPAAHAASPDFNVNTPEIRRIQAQLKQRHAQLAPFYNSGAIGFTEDGLVAMRDASAVSLRDRKRLQSLVDQDNNGRESLYRAVANANGHPEWLGQVRSVFAKTWVDKAEKGWWYRQGGKWLKK